MNTVITDGLNLMPPAFEEGLGVWSREDGTAGSATYEGVTYAAVVGGDQDFGTGLELVKINALTKVRWMGRTPVKPGVYLQVRARVKAISGPLPAVRIAAYPVDAQGNHLAAEEQVGVSTTLTSYGEVVEVSAIIGVGNRNGVDMAWPEASYAHVGIDLTGLNGGVVRIDDLVVEDATPVFFRNLMDWVDVRDYGAVGDGTTDDTAAFRAADTDAKGREVVVPAGNFFINSNLTMESPMRFEGRLTMPKSRRLVLRSNFDLRGYIEAFGGDEVEAFRKGFQALMSYADHESFDLCGRRIDLSAPLDMHDIVNDANQFEVRRVLRNGQFYLVDGTAWAPTTRSATASYNVNDPYRLRGVTNASSIEPGSIITGHGVGREVYVKAVYASQNIVEISQPLYGVSGTQSYTFTRWRYALDFSGFQKLSKFVLTDIEIQCRGIGEGILLAPAGVTFHVKDCHITKPAHRAISSHGRGCQDLLVDRCHFTSNEQSTPVSARVSQVLNVNANDAKIRDSRFQRFGTTMILHGNGHLIVGNHWFQGDDVTDGVRIPGLVFTYPNVKSVVTGNYIDNCSIEMTNEHDPEPDLTNEYTFGGLSVTGNIFTVNDAAAWHSWLIVKPYGEGHGISGLSVTGNTFKSINGRTTRVDRVDDSIAKLDPWKYRNIMFENNLMTGIDKITQNPASIKIVQNTAASTWVISTDGHLPFEALAREVDAVVLRSDMVNGSGSPVNETPRVSVAQGANGDQIHLKWSQACKGTVRLRVRGDNPL